MLTVLYALTCVGVESSQHSMKWAVDMALQGKQRLEVVGHLCSWRFTGRLNPALSSCKAQGLF